jgi:hypothetical protein
MAICVPDTDDENGKEVPSGFHNFVIWESGPRYILNRAMSVPTVSPGVPLTVKESPDLNPGSVLPLLSGVRINLHSCDPLDPPPKSQDIMSCLS